MKRIVLWMFMAGCFSCSFQGINAQEILFSKFNGFTGEHEIETTIVSLKEGFSTGFGAAFRAQDGHLLMSLIGYGKKNTIIKEEERLQFILKDGTIVRFNSRVQLPSNDSQVPNLYIHHYYISKLEVQALTKNPVVTIRKVSVNGQADVKVGKRNASRFVKLCKLFLKELNKF